MIRQKATQSILNGPNIKILFKSLRSGTFQDSKPKHLVERHLGAENQAKCEPFNPSSN